MRYLLFAVTLTLAWVPCRGEDAVRVEQQARSSVPAEARFEVVQSTIKRSLTLLVDKYWGRVWQLVVNDDGEEWWAYLPRHHHEGDPERQDGDAVNYQVFLGGMMVRDAYLVNVRSGATWSLTVDPDGVLYWRPMPYPSALRETILPPAVSRE